MYAYLESSAPSATSRIVAARASTATVPVVRGSVAAAVGTAEASERHTATASASESTPPRPMRPLSGKTPCSLRGLSGSHMNR